ncbi:endonuclease V [Paractinoplanes maris]|uniref:endonuclease V n=1 Tax=Paractinoplanes maris TaxID=1734446 RepID=UPI00202186BF|nr:endonuclease V [Actinoplanes maris]
MVVPSSPIPWPRTVVGLDVTYEVGSDRAVAAAVVVDVATLAVEEVVTYAGETSFPYVPGLLAFREVPLLLAAIERLSTPPSLLVCDGYGLAHPRRFGLACHLGVLLDLPSFGVAKTAFVGSFDDPATDRGASSDLVDAGEVVGRVVRTQPNVKPVFVSPGHRIGLAESAELSVRLSSRYRIPEPTRQADILSRSAFRSL